MSIDRTCISLVNVGAGHTIGGGGGETNLGEGLRLSLSEPPLLPMLPVAETLEQVGSSEGEHEGKWKPRTWEFLHLQRPKIKTERERVARRVTLITLF